MLKPFLLVPVVLTPFVRAAETTPAPEAKKPDPPRLLLALPLAISAGTTNTVQLRGLNLTNITELRFNSRPIDGLAVSNQSAGKADVLKDYDAKKFGDTRIDATIAVPCADANGGGAGEPPTLVAVAPTGESEPMSLWVLPAGTLTDEREPNAGWRDAPLMGPVQYIRGTIQEPADVDVFRWKVQPGDRWRFQVHAASRGSALDSLVTIYDSEGNILASNDDVAGKRDSTVEWSFQRGGFVAVVVQDAHDKGGAAHAYVLEVTGPKPAAERPRTRASPKRTGRRE